MPKKKVTRRSPEAHAPITASPGSIWIDGRGVLNIGCPDLQHQINILFAKRKEIQVQLVDLKDLYEGPGPVLHPKAKCPYPPNPLLLCGKCHTIKGKGLMVENFVDDPR